MGLDETRPGRVSTYLDHLPALFREAPDDPAEAGFLGRFLLAFEHVLTGLRDAGDPGGSTDAGIPVDPGVPPGLGLDELLDRVPRCLSPDHAPAAFLDWLAGWVALTLRPDLESGGDRELARTLVAGAVPLYRLRGTKQGVVELIRLLTGGLAPTVTEPAAPLQLGVASSLGVHTRVEGGAPHFFHVLLRLPQPDPAARRRVEELVRAILDVEKPAHTHYRLEVTTPAMRIGAHTQIGVDTLLVPAGNPGDP